MTTPASATSGSSASSAVAHGDDPGQDRLPDQADRGTRCAGAGRRARAARGCRRARSRSARGRARARAAHRRRAASRRPASTTAVPRPKPPISAMRRAYPRRSPKLPRAAIASTPAAMSMRMNVAVAGPKSRRAITSSGNESTNTLIAKASSANAERGGWSVTEERRAGGRARRPPPCARPPRAAARHRPGRRPRAPVGARPTRG